MNENIFDIQAYTDEVKKYRKLTLKFGLAMIVLVLNKFFSPYFFIRIVHIFGGVRELDYYGIMVLNEFAAYFFPVLIFSLMFRNELRTAVPDHTYKPFFAEAVMMFITGMTVGGMGTLITQSINSVIDYFFKTGEIEDVFAGMEPQNMGEFTIFAICLCIVAPVVEEILFRHLLLKPLRAYGDLTAVVVSGTIFGLYHGNFDQFAYATLLGIFLSIIAVRYNSIIPTILLHAINNTLVTCGNNLETPSQSALPAIRTFLSGFSAVCSFISVILIPAGFITLFICIAKKCFTLHSRNPYLTQNQAFLEFVKSPLVILGVIVMFIPFFI